MEWSPGPKYRAYIGEIQELLEDEERTVRDVYYALESRGFPEALRDASYQRALNKHYENPDNNPDPDVAPESEWKWEFEYRFVKRAVKKGRRAGYIDPELIVDTSRSAVTTTIDGYDDPEDFIESRVEDIENAYIEPFWDEQPEYVEVWLEKQSLASVFAPICRDRNVRLEATRGDWSDSKIYRAAQRLLDRIHDGKDVTILYFGDYNPSGFHAPVAIQNTMAHYGLEIGDREVWDDEYYFDPAPMGRMYTDDGDGSILFDRIAINSEHIERFDLPTNPNPSSTDKDTQLRERFVEAVAGDDVNVELNALKEFEREFLEDLVADAIDDHIDTEIRQRYNRRVLNRRSDIADAISVDRGHL